jgi:PAS domain S-box-containing protein
LLPSGKFSRMALAVAAALAAGLVLTSAGIRASATNRLYSDLLQTAIALWAAYCCFHVARSASGHLRQLWTLFSAALFVATAAQALEAYCKNVLHLPTETPWPSDVLFILWVIPVVMMLFPQPAEERGRINWLAVLDFAQIGIVALTAYLYFFYVPSRWEVEGKRLVLEVMSVQALRDATLGVAIFVHAGRASQLSFRTFFGRLSAFFLFMSACEFSYLFSGTSIPGSSGWPSVVWSAPYLCATVFAATWKRSDSTPIPRDGTRNQAMTASQILPVSIPLLVLLMGRRIAVEQLSLAWVAVGGSFLVSAARLMVTNERQGRIARELLETEQALVRSEQMFSTAFRLSPDAVGISVFPEGRFVEVNDSFTRFSGYTREETVGRTGQELNLWVDLVHRAKVMEKLGEEGEVREEEFQCRTKSGEIRLGQFTGALIEINGRFHALVVIHDVTARRKAEEALRASEKLFRSLVESLHVGIVLSGREAEILFANQAALRMFKLPIGEVLGKNSSELGLVAIYEDGTEMPFPMRPGPRTLATGKAVRNEVMGWRLKNTDEVLWILGETVPIFEENGRIEKLVISFSDITKRKNAEEALHQLSTRLLQLQDEERRRLGRELHDSLAQSVLAVNLNLAQVGRGRASLDEKSQRAISEARRVLKEMSQEIRTLSYLLHPPVLDELGLTSAVKEYAAGFSERSGIKVEVELQAGFGRLSQEAETAFFRIVQESMLNIQRHSGSQTAKIRLRGDAERVELEVSDEGRGMDLAAIEQGKKARTRLGVGILGMRERMAQLGGKLEVESNSSGTTVRAAIPIMVEVSNASSHPRGG